MRPQLQLCPLLALALLLTGTGLQAQDGDIHDGIRFGRSVLALEDIDGDGVIDIAIGAPAAQGLLECSGVVFVMSGVQ